MALTSFASSRTNARNKQKMKQLEPEQNKSRLSRAYGLWKSAWDLAFMFGKRTTIHGLNRLLGEAVGRYERFIWLLTVIFALAGSIYVCLLLSRRFSESKFQTVIDTTNLPVYSIAFPVISICNFNRLNWARIEEAKQRFLPNEHSPERLRLFERIVVTYDDIRFGHFDKFAVLQNESVDSLNHVNFSTVVHFMTWRCEELLANCVWRHKQMNCCEIFSKRLTQIGPCWAFNTVETEEGRRMKRLDPKWPWRTGGAGPGSALKVRVLINPDKHAPNRTNDKGLSVMVTEPYAWHKDIYDVPANTETTMEIDPVVYFYDNDTRSVSSDQRQCVFEDERTSSDFKSLMNYVYMLENCQSECYQEHLMRYCNCTVDLLFPPGQYPSCKAKDLLCLAQNNDHLLYSHQPGEEKFVRNQHEGMICKCFRNCYSLNYIPDVRSSFLPPDVRGNVSYVDLDIYFIFESILVYRTSLVFGWMDLMVSFGGIAGLFLGCSLISAMELIYFTCIEMPHFVCERIGFNKRQQQNSRNDADGTKLQLPSYTKKFGKIAQRNLANGRNQFEKFVINNISESQRKPPDYDEEAPDSLVLWQHHINGNSVQTTHKDSSYTSYY